MPYDQTYIGPYIQYTGLCLHIDGQGRSHETFRGLTFMGVALNLVVF